MHPFYLADGTALTLRWSHRISQDLDLWLECPVDVIEVALMDISRPTSTSAALRPVYLNHLFEMTDQLSLASQDGSQDNQEVRVPTWRQSTVAHTNHGGSGMSATIILTPIGPVPADLLPWLADRLEEVFGQSVVVGEVAPLPAAGYDSHRRQYQGDALIAVLRSLPYPAAERVLGLTNADCYAPGLNFIFGQATPGGREAFVALPRLRQSFYDLPEDPILFRQRALKEAVHELGHTWGLSHCPDPHCVMHFSNTLHDTDVKGPDFCLRCRGRLR